MPPADSAEPAAASIAPAQTWLHGVRAEQFSIGGARPGRHGLVHFLAAPGVLAGYGRVPACPATLEQQSFALYNDIFAAVGPHALYRVWNFVPGINQVAPPLLENYRLFCSGRARAFAARPTAAGPARLPAASATGSRDGFLTVLFLAGAGMVEDWENPEQVPAYQYPPEHGPRAPSFSRATRARTGAGDWVFVSGTAAIKGSKTQHPDDFPAQLAVTLDNLDLVLRHAGQSLARPAAGHRRHFRIYLRDRANLPALLARLQAGVLAPDDTWLVVEADICRKALQVEMEVMLYPRG
jgi:enamine deaminase RidA (YjgF/YER057c/UK114 family)